MQAHRARKLAQHIDVVDPNQHVDPEASVAMEMILRARGAMSINAHLMVQEGLSETHNEPILP